jgi:hypothetical protein
MEVVEIKLAAASPDTLKENMKPKVKESTENMKPMVKESTKNTKDKRCSSSAARERPRKGRHLSVVDENNLKTKVRSRGSKSSCSDKEEFVTAAKTLDEKLTITQRGKVFYRSKESSKSEHVKSTASQSNRPNARSKETKKSTKLKSSSISSNVVFQSKALQDATFIVSAPQNHHVKPKVSSVKTTTDKVMSHLHDVVTDVKIPLPEGVLNIDMDERMYEYSADVFDYLMSREDELSVPEDFLKNGGVTEKMRNTLVDWIIQVQHYMQLCQETLYHAVAILDTVLHKRDVDPDRLQLVGIASLLLASKLEEYYPASLDKLIHLTENTYTKVQLCQMERTVLSVMEFEIYIPSPQLFLLRYTKAALRQDDDQFLETCFYLIDSHLTNILHSTIANSKLAAAAVLSSCLLYFLSVNPESLPALPELWTPTLQHYSGISLHHIKDVLSVASSMLDKLRLNIESKHSHEMTGSYNKYKSMSQHKRLVLAKHLQNEVVALSLQSVEDWLWEFHL